MSFQSTSDPGSNLPIHAFLDEIVAGSATPTQSLLRLVSLLQVSGAGVANWAEGDPTLLLRAREDADGQGVPMPWDSTPILSTLDRAADGTAVANADSYSYLATVIRKPVRVGRLVWLEATGSRSWSATDRLSLLLAATALDGILDPPPTTNVDQERFRQRLHDAAALSGRLAHAFDNILTGILGFAELTLSIAQPNSEIGQYVSEVLQAAQQGAQLTQQFHQFSRASMVSPGTASASLVLTEEEQLLRARLHAGVDLAINVPAELPHVAVSTETLHQILTPVINNAAEAVEPGQSIRISARQVGLDANVCTTLHGNLAAGAHLELEVADTGPGLTPEAEAKLFVEPFFSNKPRHRGLGLAFLYRILNAHRGGISLQPGPEGGTAVKIYLPVAGHGGR